MEIRSIVTHVMWWWLRGSECARGTGLCHVTRVAAVFGQHRVLWLSFWRSVGGGGAPLLEDAVRTHLHGSGKGSTVTPSQNPSGWYLEQGRQPWPKASKLRRHGPDDVSQDAAGARNTSVLVCMLALVTDNDVACTTRTVTCLSVDGTQGMCDVSRVKKRTVLAQV